MSLDDKAHAEPFYLPWFEQLLVHPSCRSLASVKTGNNLLKNKKLLDLAPDHFRNTFWCMPINLIVDHRGVTVSSISFNSFETLNAIVKELNQHFIEEELHFKVIPHPAYPQIVVKTNIQLSKNHKSISELIGSNLSIAMDSSVENKTWMKIINEIQMVLFQFKIESAPSGIWIEPLPVGLLNQKQNINTLYPLEYLYSFLKGDLEKLEQSLSDYLVLMDQSLIHFGRLCIWLDNKAYQINGHVLAQLKRKVKRWITGIKS